MRGFSWVEAVEGVEDGRGVLGNGYDRCVDRDSCRDPATHSVGKIRLKHT